MVPRELQEKCGADAQRFIIGAIVALVFLYLSLFIKNAALQDIGAIIMTIAMFFFCRLSWRIMAYSRAKRKKQ